MVYIHGICILDFKSCSINFFLTNFDVSRKHWEVFSSWESACMLNCFSHIWLCVTLWILAHQAPLSIGFSRQEYWSGLSCPFPGDLPDPAIEPVTLRSPALAGRFFTTSTTWEKFISWLDDQYLPQYLIYSKHSIIAWIDKWVDGWLNIYSKEEKDKQWFSHGFIRHEFRLLN